MLFSVNIELSISCAPLDYPTPGLTTSPDGIPTSPITTSTQHTISVTPVTTPHSNQETEAQSGGKSDDSNISLYIIIGCVVGGIAILCIIAFNIIYVLQKRGKSSGQSSSNIVPSIDNSIHTHDVKERNEDIRNYCGVTADQNDDDVHDYTALSVENLGNATNSPKRGNENDPNANTYLDLLGERVDNDGYIMPCTTSLPSI